MMRALLIDSPDDPAAWQADLEYLLGPDLLVAPMTDPSGTRTVYLPEGEWVDWWTGTVHTGQSYVRVSQPLDRIPLFARRGALIPVMEPADSIGDGPFEAVTLLCFDPVAGSTVIRDVDGDTVVTASVDPDGVTLTVDGPARIVAAHPAFPAPGAPAITLHRPTTTP